MSDNTGDGGWTGATVTGWRDPDSERKPADTIDCGDGWVMEDVTSEWLGGAAVTVCTCDADPPYPGPCQACETDGKRTAPEGDAMEAARHIALRFYAATEEGVDDEIARCDSVRVLAEYLAPVIEQREQAARTTNFTRGVAEARSLLAQAWSTATGTRVHPEDFTTEFVLARLPKLIEQREQAAREQERERQEAEIERWRKRWARSTAAAIRLSEDVETLRRELAGDNHD